MDKHKLGYQKKKYSKGCRALNPETLCPCLRKVVKGTDLCPMHSDQDRRAKYGNNNKIER